MDMSGMDMGSGSHSDSSMSMNMVFTNSHATPLFSNIWTPSSSGGFAGTCIFLILLAIIDRCLIAFKATMERYWLAKHLNQRYIAITGKSPEAGKIDADPEAKVASLVTAQGVEESVKVVQSISREPIPWRFSVDFLRALLFLLIVGVSYLLYVLALFSDYAMITRTNSCSMLAVMTMNIGYFCSVLAGAFLGELAVGRFIQTHEHGH